MAETPSRRDSAAAPDHSALPVVVALSTMLVWGGTPLFSKIAVGEIDPLMVGILRTVLAGALALPLVLLLRHPLPTTRRDGVTLAFSGFAAFVAFPLLFTVGQARTSATHGALILATLPVFTSLFGTLVERRRVTAMWVVGCSVALLGEAAVIVLRNGGAASGATVAGDLVVLASSVICATGYVAGARLTQHGYGSVPTTLWGASGAAVVLLPLMLWSVGREGWPQAGAAAWASVLVLAFLTSILGYVAWYWALARGGISRIAPIQFTQPLFGLALAAVVLQERPAPVTYAAAVAILAGAWIVLRAAPR